MCPSSESLFQLLLETTVRSTGPNDPTGQAITALSCACLFSLVVSWGDTGKILQAVSAILTNNGSHACQTIQVIRLHLTTSLRVQLFTHTHTNILHLFFHMSLRTECALHLSYLVTRVFPGMSNWLLYVNIISLCWSSVWMTVRLSNITHIRWAGSWNSFAVDRIFKQPPPGISYPSIQLVFQIRRNVLDL